MEYNKNSISSSITPIDPSTLFVDGYELSNSIITTEEFKGSFTPDLNNIEFYIYDSNKNLLKSEYEFTDYFIAENPNPNPKINLKTGKVSVQSSTINLTPEDDIFSRGYTNGNLYAVYNFVNYELGSTSASEYYISEISSDRTEIRIKSNKISTRVMKQTFVDLQKRLSLNSPEAPTSMFDEFYISFGQNEYQIGVNIKFDDTYTGTNKQVYKDNIIKSGNTVGQTSILIKLVDALPSKFDISSRLYVATKPAESQAYLVEFPYDPFTQDDITYLKGPNSNLKINDFVNDSTTYSSKDSLLETKSTGSKDQLLYKLNQKGITLDVNYSTASFNDFVNFSSAKSRVSNFVEKVSRIQAYEADLNALSSITSSNPGVVQISESIASLYTKIENEIVSFDGFDYYQYYNTGSDAYPKTGTVFPLQLLATQSADAQAWIQATEASASVYDENNQNWLYYTIPDFIKNNTSNANYLEFVNMIGQSFDEVWLYTKAIAEKNNTTNQFDKGVPLQLADDVITSLGYTGYGNNYNNQDNFIGLIGNDNGSFVPPTGSELINHYIAINGPGGIRNYWEDFYSDEDYVESFRSLGFPYPIDRVSKEIFKRLYHNMSYLVKKKGTISGLRQLINIWGIPNTILRINEFGGKNKDEENDYDLWYQRYSYAFSPVPAGTNYASASVRIPWQPLQRNYNYSANRLVIGENLGTSVFPDIIQNCNSSLTGVGPDGLSSATGYDISAQFTYSGKGSGGTITFDTNGAGVISQATIKSPGSGYAPGDTITITAAQINNLNSLLTNTPTATATGNLVFTITAAQLGSEEIVPDGIGFRFKTTGYPSSSWGGNYDSQSLFIKKSTNSATDADMGIVLYYTGSTSGSGAGNTGPTYLGGNSSAYKDYGEMRFFIKGDPGEGGTVMSDPIYLPFFDKGWWNVQFQRDQHPIVTDNSIPTTYTLYVGNKIYDGADGNQIGFTGSVSISSNQGGNFSSSINESWNNYSLDLAAYGAGAYLGGWGNTLTSGTTGSIGVTSTEGAKGVQNAGKNFSGSLQEFRYYSHDISQSVFHDAVMNPESIEGNNITGSESSFDIINFRAPLGNELEHIFTSSFTTQYIEQIESVHPAITGSSPLTITGSFYNPGAIANPTSSYDVTYNANASTRTYSNTNVETYFLDQPSIGIRNRVSNKIKYSTNLNFGKTLSNRVSIQQDPPISQSYTDNINLLEVAFSPTEEVNDDIIQALGYGAIQEVIADPRFRSSSEDYYPGLQEISDAYFKKYTNRNQTDYLRLIKYFDNSLFQAIKNYVPVRTSVSTGVVIKQHMLERNRYREPQVDIVTTQSYAPFNQPLTAKNLELTGSVNTNQLWDPVKQETYYSSSDVQTFSGGAGGSVNQYNVLEEGGGLIALESDDLALKAQGRITSGTTILVTNGLLTTPAITVGGTPSITVPGNGTISGTGATFDVLGFNNEIISVTANAEGTGYVNGDIIVIAADDLTGGALGTVTTDLRFRVSGVDFTSIFEAEPLEEVTKDIVLVNANNLQTQGTATITMGLSDQAANGAGVPYSDDFAIQITTIDPSDGSLITKKYCSSTTGTPAESGGYVLWDGTSTNANTKAQSLADAINSQFGQGSGATTPTLTAVVSTDQIILTQLYGGTDGNTTIVYGSILKTIGSPTGVTMTSTVGSGYNLGGSGLQPTTYTGTQEGFSGGSNATAASGLQVSYNVNIFGSVNSISSTAGGNRNYTNGYTLDLGPGASTPTTTAQVTVQTTTTIDSISSAAFTGGTAIFKNTFLNALKSVQTPIYVDYNFKSPGPAPSVAVTIQASSSIRGVIYNNTTTYTDQDPAGSILVDPQGQKQYLDMHPGEDVFISINSIPDITVDNYQIILGENILIATALAAQSIVSSTTLIIDSISDDIIPPVGSLVTGPEVKAGVVTTLGAVQTAGTGYDPSTVQVLPTTGAGGNNLTLTVTTNANGNVTTAALSNPGTGYSTNDVVTIVGGDNNATVAITVATPLAVLINDFDPTNNKITFNSNQTITDNSKLTFTTTAIPNPDTIPVSQQGYFANNVNALGVNTSWDSYQNQFYDGEYSGSTIVVDDYFKEQYNPYKKVKGNSIPISETTVAVDCDNGVASAGMSILSSTTSGFTFNTNGGVQNRRETYLGITALELIPYQTYKVTYTLLTTIGGGSGMGFFPENYGYNNTSYGLYPQIVSSYTGTIGGANTGYSINNNVATTPPGGRVPTVATGGTGYPASSTFTVETFPKDGAGQTLEVTTDVGGAITGVTLVEPGSGYLVDVSGNPTVLTVNGGFLDPNDASNVAATINAGAGGVVVDIIDINAAGTIQTNGIEIVNGGNGLYQQGDVITITGGDGTATFTINQPTGASLNGVTNSDTGEDFTRPVDGITNNREFTFKYLPPLSGNTAENGRYSLGWYATTGGGGTSQQAAVTNITVTGIGGIYENVEAPIFLTQQDRGYDNQKDYQNMGPKDILGNVIAGSPTIIGSISGPIPLSKQQIISTTVGTLNGSLSGITGNGSQGGTGAQFTITTTGTQFTITTVSCDIGGTEYIPGDTITIAAATLTGGALGTVTTDLVFRVTSTGIVKPGIPKNGGTGYTTATNVGTTSTGIGTGLKVDTTAVAGAVTLVSINAASYVLPLADNYNTGDSVTITGGNSDATFTILSTKGEIDLIQNTQSVIFNQSDYNPLNNNVNTNRSSSNRYILSYGATQSVPNNFDLVVTASYFPTSPSGTFPELADVPDSNYTMPSSINARYAGTKLKSLNYNFFTPSGSVGPPAELPQEPFNTRNLTRRRVANEFLDGSITSSFIQAGLGEGSPSWEGDSKQNRGESTIDKHPIYMARFENSYEQLAMYDTYQFNIDQLIEVPREDIAGSEITPNSITIDGSNQNKKVVSSVFEPKRKVSVSYLNPKTPAIDYTTLTIGNFDILSGATEFLTINSNAKNRVSGSLAYQYTLGSTPSTGSRPQLEDTIQMVTSSIVSGDPVTTGVLGGTLSTQGTLPSLQETPAVILTGVPVDSSNGRGATVTITWNTSGVYQSAVVDNTGGTGYLNGDQITIPSTTLNQIAYNLGFTRQSTQNNTLDLVLTVAAGNVTSGGSIVTNGFLLSGSLTTDDGIGDNEGAPGTDIFSSGIGFVTPASTVLTNCTTFSAGGGTGMTVNVSIVGNAIVTMQIVNGGSGYSAGDFIGVKNAELFSQGMTAGTGTLTSRALTASDLTGGGTPYMINFNPSPVASVTALESEIISDPTVPLAQQLLIGGPQLALYHAYNSTVSQSLTQFNTNLPVSDIGPTTRLWTTSGSNPSIKDNYYVWSPDGSDSQNYQSSNQPFLIERGDIIRVESVLTQRNTDTLITSSFNVIEDFTVQEVRDYYYSSSFDDNNQDASQLDSTISLIGTFTYATAFTDPDTFAPAGLPLSPSTWEAYVGITSDVLLTGNTNEGAKGGPAGNTTTACKITIVCCANGAPCNASGIFSFTLENVDSYGWSPGDTITIKNGALSNAGLWTGTPPSTVNGSVTITIVPEMINQSTVKDFNNFTIGVDTQDTGVQESGSVQGYHLYEKGEVGFTAPTFLRVTPDPITTLNGIPSGAITKFTVRRQIEADDKVMVKNITPPSGSKGVQTQSGQGFLIPDDFSEIQKSNALNIINQLKAKNAFNKPIEPGITDGGTSISVQGSGSDTIINIP